MIIFRIISSWYQPPPNIVDLGVTRLKSRSKRKPKKSSRNQVSWSGMAARPSRRNNIILGVVAVALLVLGAAYFWRGNQASNAFEALAATGQAALSQVVTPFSDLGNPQPIHGQTRVL
jgi:hypothetical protein